MNSDVIALVKAIVTKDEWDAVGALVDKLIELDREKEAALLKRRYAKWRQERESDKARLYQEYRDIARMSHEVALAHLTPHNLNIAFLAPTDRRFRDYIRERFPAAQLEDVTLWVLAGNYTWGHVVAKPLARCQLTACGIYTANGCTKNRPPGICRKCRLALATMTLRPQEVPS